MLLQVIIAPQWDGNCKLLAPPETASLVIIAPQWDGNHAHESLFVTHRTESSSHHSGMETEEPTGTNVASVQVIIAPQWDGNLLARLYGVRVLCRHHRTTVGWKPVTRRTRGQT